MVMPGWLKSSTLVALVNLGLDARPNMQTLVFENVTKSMILARSAFWFSGPIMMSI